MTRKPWFHGKRHGYGWGKPTGKEGWTVLLLYIVIAASLCLQLETMASAVHITLFVVQFILLSILLFVICFATGEDRVSKKK